MMTPNEIKRDQDFKNLADAAMREAVAGARQYCNRHQVEMDAVAISKVLPEHVRPAIREALADAREAVACNMHGIAETTFRLTMRQAGINAAREMLGHTA